MKTHSGNTSTRGSDTAHPIVSRAVWLRRRRALLGKEAALVRQRDQVRRARRALPWVKIDKSYVFDGPDGKETLVDLFGGRSQLIVYHFMFGPDWDEGCVGCSFLADHIDGANLHLAHLDVTLVVVSRAPLRKLAAFKQRMGWRFKWVSSLGSDFNFDYHVSFTPAEIARGRFYYNYEMTEAGSEEQPGLSAFYKDETGEIFHTYSAYLGGMDELMGTNMYLDFAPLGRAGADGIDWPRHHDKYEDEDGAASAVGKKAGRKEKRSAGNTTPTTLAQFAKEALART